MPSIGLRLAGISGTVSGGGGGGTTGTLQAEDAALNGPVKYLAGDTGHTVAPGYSGSGYVGDWGATAQTVTFALGTVTAGTYKITYRYQRANTSDASRQIFIYPTGQPQSSTPVATVQFPQTGSDWAAGSWSTVEMIYTFSATQAWTLTMQHPGPDFDNYIDIDQITLAPTTTPPPSEQPPPGTGGTADFRVMFDGRYPASSSATMYVDAVNGNNANAGSSVAPKQTIQAAVAAMTSSGTILVRNGTYTGTVELYQKNFAANGWLRIMNDVGHSPFLRSPAEVGGGDGQGGERSMLFRSSSYCAVYGLEIKGYDFAGHQIADCISHRESDHHIAIWKCYLHDGTHGIGVAGNQGGQCNHWEACYNRITFCGKYLPQAASGISFYEFWNGYQGGDDPSGSGRGYSNYVVGNVCWNNYNDPSTAATDGNGIIIDDFSNSQIGGTPFGGKTLVLGNLTVYNGGRGVHAFASPNVYEYFNTVAHNLRLISDANAGELSQLLSGGGQTKWNICCPRSDKGVNFDGGIKWYDDYQTTVTPTDNVVLRGSSPAGSLTNNINRNTEGEGYFVSANDTMTNIAGWKPDGGTGVVERRLVPQTDYDQLAYWPDYFGTYRPTNRSWACGFCEP